MAERKLRGRWLINLTLLVALYLQALPMTDAWLLWRPEWLALILLYWCVMSPHRVSVTHGFICGLLLDLIEGTLLGQNAVALSLLCYLGHLTYQRVRMYNMVKQSGVIAVFIGISQLVFQWLQSVSGSGASIAYLMLPAVVSGLIWPWLSTLLHALRRRFGIN
ncbi:rod shape-determining protein MreD [Terasakiispira papahanaumokuakeensis]|uniref:Rod shape-determining protein MreD n=1 Tax=Terasakiispira papahanaumokuakeensis TaxID=197479 RepID=A0A1E2V728_9GAMM|nr:rod shape-determining protein MreD [Terasakiispira papahanaumokuakeensis]ODC02656.1 rod shape-determining protein MreD [Terasakiispira papahanaumokuakeensis]